MRYSNIFSFLFRICLIVIVLFSCNTDKNAKTTNTDSLAQTNTTAPIQEDTGIRSPVDSGTAPAPGGSDREDFRIHPGSSIGKIDIGMRQETVLAVLGKPDSTDAAMGTFVYTWLGKTKPYRSELNVVTVYADSDMKNRAVKMVRTTSPYFLTASGVGVQKNLAEIKQKFPLVKLVKTYESMNHQAKTDIWADEGAGILFECLSNDQKLCVGVQVFKPGALPGMEF